MDRGARFVIPTLLATAAAAALLVVLGGRPSAEIEIIEIEPHSDSGVVHAIDVELASDRLLEPQQLIFTVIWAGFPHRWIAEDLIDWADGKTVAYRLTPETPRAIPPIERTGNGKVQPRPFRLRVNESGQSEFIVSDVVVVPPQIGSLVNTEFQTWERSTPTAFTPRGWLLANRDAEGATVEVRPHQGGRGLTTRVQHVGQTDRGWVEAALYQSVASLASCYELRFSASHGYRRDEDRALLSAAGVQVIQGTRSVWWVASSSAEERASDLGGTVIVEVPTEPTVSTTAILRIAGEDYLGLRVGTEAVIKVFNVMHESQGGSRTATFEWLRPLDCA